MIFFEKKELIAWIKRNKVNDQELSNLFVNMESKGSDKDEETVEKEQYWWSQPPRLSFGGVAG